MLLLFIHLNHTCPTYVALHRCAPYRYERSQKQAAFGRSLVQRHVALPEDIANEAGEGLLVSITPRVLLVVLITGLLKLSRRKCRSSRTASYKTKG